VAPQRPAGHWLPPDPPNHKDEIRVDQVLRVKAVNPLTRITSEEIGVELGDKGSGGF
jgi:hypothetical protein